MFRSSNRNASFARPLKDQGTRVIAIDDLDLYTKPVEHKTQFNGNTTALFTDAYKMQKAPKIEGGSSAGGFPEPMSDAAAWAKAESDLVTIREMYNKTLSVVETQKFLQRIYTPKSYLPPSVSASAQELIAQATNILKPSSTQPPGVSPATQPTTVIQPITQPGDSGSTRPPTAAGSDLLTGSIGSGLGVVGYFMNNAYAVGPVVIYKAGGVEPQSSSTVVLPAAIGPVWISGQGEAPYFFGAQSFVGNRRVVGWNEGAGLAGETIPIPDARPITSFVNVSVIYRDKTFSSTLFPYNPSRAPPSPQFVAPPTLPTGNLPQSPPFVAPPTLPTGNAPAQPISTPTGTGVVPSGTGPQVPSQPVSSASGIDELNIILSSGMGLSVYAISNQVAVGPITIYRGPTVPTITNQIENPIGPVTISGQGTIPYFISKSSDVGARQIVPWFPPLPSSPPSTALTVYQMPGSKPLLAPAVVTAIAGSQSYPLTISPPPSTALVTTSTESAIDLKADADLVSKLKTIQPTDADSLMLTALSYKGEPDFVPTSMPTLSTTTALAPYYTPLMRRVNMLIYSNANPIKAEEFVIIISNGGYQYVFKAFEYLLKETTQFTRFINLLGNVVSFLLGKTIILLRFTAFVYTMTCFYLLQDAPLAIPTDATIQAATRKAVDFMKFGMKTFLRYSFYQSSTALPSMIKFASRSGVIYQGPTEKEIQDTPIPLEPTEAEKQALLLKVEQDLEAITSEPPRYVDEDVVANFSDVNVSGTTISGPAGQAIGDGGEAGEEIVETMIEKFWEMLFGQVPGTVAVISTVLSGISGRARLFRTLALGSVFGMSAIFMGLNTFAFGYGVPVSFVMLLNILQQTYAGFLASGTVTRLRDENLAMQQDIGIRDGRLNTLQAQMRSLASTLAESALVDVGDVGRNVAGLLERIFNRGYQQAVSDAARAGSLAARFSSYSKGISALSRRVPMNSQSQRRAMRDLFADFLESFGIPRNEIVTVINVMQKPDKAFMLFTFGPGAQPIPYNELFLLLEKYQTQASEFINAFFQGKLEGLKLREQNALSFARRFRVKEFDNIDRERWIRLLTTIFGLNFISFAQKVKGDDFDTSVYGEDYAAPPVSQPSGPIIGETGDGSRPGEEGTAIAVSVPTPQYTDAPPSITLEAALELLQDNTNSVEQITRSGAPDSYKWVLVKYRRKSLRALWYAVFVGLKIPESDATQALNFMDPTFVDASKNVNEYSGIRTNGAHGVYPRFDQFLIRNRNVINEHFTTRSPQIRVKYAAVFFSRFFGLRGKYYAKDLFGLSTTELSQAAQLSRIAIDVLQMDSTHSDGQPPDRMPTTADLRGYRTGPEDFSNKLIAG